MTKFIFRTSFLFVFLIILSLQAEVNSKTSTQQPSLQVMNNKVKPGSLNVSPDYRRIPLYFIPNEGQIDEKALFYAKTPRYTLWLTKDGLIFDSSRMVFLNAHQNPQVLPIDITDYRVSCFAGNDKSKWRTGIQASKAVLYQDLYVNIDLKLYGMENQIEYDFVVKPGGKVSDITLAFRDVQQSRIDEEGNLRVKTKSVGISHSAALAEFAHQKPLCYQVIDGRRIEIEASFNRITSNTYGFDVGFYDASHDLIIDPLVLTYSTYLGGSSDDYGYGIAVDSSGAAYITGTTQSTDFPSQNSYQATNSGSQDVFITKINPAGTALVYSTYLGGSDDDEGKDITVDSTGAAYITGKTKSSNFPIHNPIDGTYNGGDLGDAFITKLSPTGISLVYSTYLGGSDTDRASGIAIDPDGAAYITGGTYSTDFPTLNAFQATHADRSDVFVTKINPAGDALVYSTFLGGGGNEEGEAIAVDSQKMVCVTGFVASYDFPALNPLRSYKYYDVFITKLDSSGSALIFSTFLGDWDTDGGTGIAVDADDSIYVTGYTTTADLPWGHPKDAFVVKMPASGSDFDYVQQWGCGSWSKVIGWGIAVDADGAAYVVESDSYEYEPADAVITKLSSNGGDIVYRYYLGGAGEDWGFDIALDSEHDVYVIGRTDSSDFPTLAPIQGSNAGGNDVFVSKIPANPKPDIKANGSDGPITISNKDTLTVTVSMDAGVYKDRNVDMWLVAHIPSPSPHDWYHYDIATKSWKPGKSVSYQGALMDINLKKVFNQSGLKQGSYSIHFGVDMNMNGLIDADQKFNDKVKVTITN